VSEDRNTVDEQGQRAESDGAAASNGPSPKRGRRRLLVAGIVALVVVFGVIVPGYVATRPSYLQRYPNLRAAHETWATSVHAQATCQSCHVPPGFLAQTGYSLRMLGEFYISIVDRSREPDLLDKPTNAACSRCHIDLRTVSPSGDLNIPHRAHVSVLKLDCITCHEFLVHEASPEGKHTPRMAACLTCHDGVKAKNACSTCHTSKAAPANHRSADWLIVHPERQGTLNCKTCHSWTDKWCAECHSKRPKSHTADWRTRHGAAVKSHRNCEACHEPAFCVRCHGEVPKQNLNPSLTLVR
jgi:hypothetical protein